METREKNLNDYIEEGHTEYCGGSGIGYEMECLETQITDRVVDKLKPPKLSDIATDLERLRNSDEETANDLLKKSVEFWIGAKCLDALFASKKFNVTQGHLETLSVCITLADNWQEWLKK